MFITLRYVLITALRDRLFPVLIITMMLASFVASAMASTSMIEESQMSLVFSAGVIRIIMAVGLIVFIAFHIRYAFDNKEIDVLLSRPISRVSLIYAYWLSFAFLSILISLAAILIIWFLGPESHIGLIHWSVSLILEMWIISAFALLTSLMLSSSVVSVISSLLIYVLARMMGYFLATIDGSSAFRHTAINMISKETIDKIAIIVPRLDFFAPSEWLIYGVTDVSASMSLYLMQTAIFIPLLLVVAIIDFKKKEF